MQEVVKSLEAQRDCVLLHITECKAKLKKINFLLKKIGEIGETLDLGLPLVTDALATVGHSPDKCAGLFDPPETDDDSELAQKMKEKREAEKKTAKKKAVANEDNEEEE